MNPGRLWLRAGAVVLATTLLVFFGFSPRELRAQGAASPGEEPDSPQTGETPARIFDGGWLKDMESPQQGERDQPELDRQLPVRGRWVRHVSPHFELCSQWSEKDSRDFLFRLEAVRAAFVERLGFVERARVEVTLLAFAAEKDVRPFAPEEGLSTSRISPNTYFVADRDRATFALGPSGREGGAWRAIIRACIHQLFRAGEEAVPLWFEEGMAELHAGIRVVEGRLVFMPPTSSQMRRLEHEPLLSFITLFSVDRASPIYESEDNLGLFRAQSWALLHYWFFGNPELKADAVRAFLRVESKLPGVSGRSIRERFNVCFGRDYSEVLKSLEQYVRSGAYRDAAQAVPAGVRPESFTAEKIPAATMRARLAEWNARLRRTGAADGLLLNAARRVPKDPRPWEAFGTFLLERGDRVAAEGCWEKAIALGTQNPAIVRELALAEGRALLGQFDPDLHLPDEVAIRLRTHLKQSIEREPEQHAAYEMLAWVEALADRREIANVNLVQEHFPLLPDKARTLVALALVRERMGQYDDALRLAGKVPLLAPDAWAAAAAEVLCARLEARGLRRADDERTDAAREMDMQSPGKDMMRVPSVPLPDDL
jgi:tetratricopeptide (TPR) repeat protein